MLKYFLFACVVAMVSGGAILTPRAYYAPAPLVAAAPALPLAYARIHSPASAVETYNSVATADSFQQQYRSDYQPLTYSTGFIY